MIDGSTGLSRLIRAVESKTVDENCTVWMIDWQALSEINEDSLALFLDPSSHSRFSKIAKWERRQQFLLGRLLLKHALSIHSGVPFDKITVSEIPDDSPSVSAAGWLFNDIYFSISHSRNLIGCAVSMQGPIGLDIEIIDDKRNIKDIARIAFQENEYDWILHQPSDKRQSRFNLIWTRKESCYKLISKLKKSQKAKNLYQINVLDNGTFRWKSWMEYGFVISVCQSLAFREAQ